MQVKNEFEWFEGGGITKESSRVAVEQLTTDFFQISYWDRKNMVVFNSSNTWFLHLFTQNLFQIKSSTVLNIITLTSSLSLSCVCARAITLVLLLNKFPKCWEFSDLYKLFHTTPGVIFTPCIECLTNLRWFHSHISPWKKSLMYRALIQSTFIH